MSNDSQTNASKVRALRSEIEALPDLEPPASVWQAVLAASDEDRRRWYEKRPLALAASVFVAAALSMFVIDPFGSQAGSAQTSSLMQQSQLLEGRLQTMPVSVYEGTGTVLRHRIGDVDRSLNRLYADRADDPLERERLLRQRIELLESLLEVERRSQNRMLRKVVF